MKKSSENQILCSIIFNVMLYLSHKYNLGSIKMENKKDWEELEKWSKNQEDKRVKDYGIDISNVDWNKRTKRMGIFAKFTNGIYKLVVFVSLSIVFLLIAVVLLWSYSKFEEFGRNFDAGDIKKNMEDMYCQKLITVSEETDEKGNGKYIFALKKNKNITFTAFKDGRNSSEDFLANSHKYFFDAWDSKYKDSFTVNEEMSNGLLKYSMYIEISGYKDIDAAMEKFNAFVKYCDFDIYYMWNMYLKSDKMRIQLYNSSSETIEVSTVFPKVFYLKYLRLHNLEEDIPAEEFEKYLGEN